MKVSASLCVLLLGLLRPEGVAGASEPPTVNAREDGPPLEIGTPIRRDLSAKQAHRYRLEMGAGEFVHVAVRQIGIDVGVSLLSPDGKSLIEIDTPSGRYGTEDLAWIAKELGL